MPADPQAFALAYAGNGWHVLPCWWVTEGGRCACGDPVCGKNAGKHPLQKLVPNGFKDATTRADVIGLWWGAYPQANVAIVCQASGLVVIDVDPRNGGEQTWADIESRVEVPATARASTGGGGMHLVFSDEDLRAGGYRPRGKLGPGVDVKWSGYILAAPSNHVSGGAYSWDNLLPPARLGAGGLIELVAQADGNHSPASNSLTQHALDVASLFEGVKAGGRHAAFVSYAASLRARRVREVEAAELIERAWSRADEGDHPFPLAEAMRILHDTYATRPEGTTNDVVLEKYRGYVDYAREELQQTNVINANGNGHKITIEERIRSLPDVLRDGVTAELMRQDVRTFAQQIRNADEFKSPDGGRLDELLKRGAPDPVWTVDQLHERGTNMTLTAQFKAGKTTFQLNMMRALADNIPFLGIFNTRPLSGNVAFFNYELTEAQFLRWAGRMRIVHPERIFVLNMRGLKLDLGDEYTSKFLVNWLREREIEYWWVDPLARAYYGDENDNTQLKKWTDQLDHIKRESGVVDVQVSLHTGRGEMEEGTERARGATRIDDWADGRMILTRQNDQRFFRAEGRDVDVAEMMLTFDESTWTYTVNNTLPVSRGVYRDFAAQQKVVDALSKLGARSIGTGVRISVLRDAIIGDANKKRTWVTQAVTAGMVQSDGVVYWTEETEASVTFSASSSGL